MGTNRNESHVKSSQSIWFKKKQPWSSGNEIAREPLKYITLLRLHQTRHVGEDKPALSLFQRKQRDSPKCVCTTENWSTSSSAEWWAGLWERGLRGFWRCCRRAASVCWRWGGWVLSCHCSTSHHNWNNGWGNSHSRGGNENKSTNKQKILHYDPHIYSPTHPSTHTVHGCGHKICPPRPPRCNPVFCNPSKSGSGAEPLSEAACIFRYHSITSTHWHQVRC